MPAASPSPLLAATLRKRKIAPASRLMRWSDLPKRFVRPLAVVRATDHPAYPRHRHEFWEIVIVNRGSGTMLFELRTQSSVRASAKLAMLLPAISKHRDLFRARHDRL